MTFEAIVPRFGGGVASGAKLPHRGVVAGQRGAGQPKTGYQEPGDSNMNRHLDEVEGRGRRLQFPPPSERWRLSHSRRQFTVRERRHHEALIAAGGVYAELHRQQMLEEELASSLREGLEELVRLRPGDGDLAIIAVPGGRLAVPVDRMPDTNQVHVGVRPEKLNLVPAEQAPGTASQPNRLAAVVTESRFIGVSTEYAVRSEDATARATGIEDYRIRRVVVTVRPR